MKAWLLANLALTLALGNAGLCCAASIADCNSANFQTVVHRSHDPVGAQAYWFNREAIRWPGVSSAGKFRLYYSHSAALVLESGKPVRGADGVIQLEPAQIATPDRFKYVGAGTDLKIAPADLNKIPDVLRSQVILVQEDQAGLVTQSTSLQIAGVLDDVYAAAQQIDDLGVSVTNQKTRFNLWAPTAQAVSLCVFPKGAAHASGINDLQRDAQHGSWTVNLKRDLTGNYYQYLVDVFVPGVGVARNRVTDPYSISLNTNSQRSYIGALEAPRLKPAGWDQTATPATVHAATDMVVYELHVRDFSVNDFTVSAAHRGKYLAFTEPASNGMQHLAALAKAGITDVHLLPVFDLATVPEKKCKTPAINPDWSGSSDQQQQAVHAVAEQDCFNWGYDPLHYSAPEGSYATDPEDGATRIVEFRKMVQALHRSGLRVGMDVVYNHTYASGQTAGSVLDRIVPGYYQRLNAKGEVEHSTCCENTATENGMMGKLLVDSVLSWARHYHIDSFRFDLMAHQPRAVMEQLQRELKRQIDHPVQLLGEGWNFGEVENGARFVQASQLSLNGSGIGTFNDRLRDAVRGGGSSDSGADLMQRKGFINSWSNQTPSAQTADLLRVGLAGSIRDYAMVTADGKTTLLKDVNYNGQPAGYVSEPGEVVNYVENHDNQTLFDLNVYKLPADTSRIDRVRSQMLGVAAVAFSQGSAYFHAGIDILRSKSLDANSFNSGDWFNRLDWSYHDNYFATGLPPEADNGKNYALMKPLLNNLLIRPTSQDILLARDMFRDLLRIRASSSLFRMKSAADIEQRLTFDNTGPGQNAAVVVAHLHGENYPDANFHDILYFINAANSTQTIVLKQEQGQHYELHPVQCVHPADARIKSEARYDAALGSFSLPALSAVVFVQRSDLGYSCP
ncbi:pullulanase [Oxalobacteraceae bacterium GrIS 2.11]